MKGHRHVDVALTVVATAWLAWSVARFPPWTVDDAFIVARYADNLVAHGELAFNAGAGSADRVEGFTSPLAMIVAVVVRAGGGDPIASTKLLCSMAALAGPALVAWLARSVRASRLAGGAAAVLFAVLPEHAMHARSGLETELFVASSLGLLVAFARLLAPRARPTAFITLSLVTALARPEGASVVVILTAFALAMRPRGERRPLARSLVIGVALPLALLALARLAYYGSLLPNTFYAKRGPWNQAHAMDLVALFDLIVVDLAVVALAAYALARVVRGRGLRTPPRLVVASAASAIALAVQLAAYARAEPIMDYGRRFAWHGTAFVAVLLLAAAEVMARASFALARRRTVVLAGVPLLAILAIASVLRATTAAETDEAYASRQAISVGPLQVPTIAWVAENTPPGALVAVYPDAGRLPYLTGRRTIDFGKLNDRVLARASSDAEVVRYFFERKPDVVVFGRKASGKLFDSGADTLVADPRFAAEYTLAKRVFGDPPGDGYEIYRRVP